MENYLRSRAKSQNDIDSCHAKQELSFKNERRKSYLWWLKHRKLYAYDQVPKHLQTNPFIIKGYRYDLSWSECISSFFLLHNETLNVWTHFIGFVLFTLYFLRDFISSRNYDNLFTTEHSTDYLMLLFYVLSVIACMLASTILHLLSGCSAKTYSTCLQLDLLGYCAQPYFPAQIIFSPNNGQTIFAIDEINQRAYKTIDYENWTDTCQDINLELSFYPQMPMIKLNQSGELQLWLESPPHRINGNQPTVLTI
ncbi:unnamed protein product [Adineta steineri]|uniref:Uncharacterized protein n=1 Tax=Adineta steineri TaxID=433720 RepID=A0A814GCQ8_9BILA|nr:unnamed protein product [Adineta steineri]